MLILCKSNPQNSLLLNKFIIVERVLKDMFQVINLKNSIPYKMDLALRSKLKYKEEQEEQFHINNHNYKIKFSNKIAFMELKIFR